MRDDEHGKPTTGTTSGGRIWTFIRILNVRLRFIFLMVLVGFVVGYWENITNYYDRWTRPASATTAVHSDHEFYCPMHPSVVRDEQGSCPICGMPLSERDKGEKQPLPEGVLARVQLTPEKVQIGRIATSPIEYRLLSREVRTVGLVDYDETRRAYIAARTKGRIEKLFVSYVGGVVKQGDPLVSIYSPNLLIAQEELLGAVRSLAQQKGAGELAVSSAQSMVDAARRKLQLWGITAEQIEQIISKGKPETNLTIYSPISGIVTEKSVLEGNYVDEGAALFTVADLSHLWMQVKVFEDQIAGVAVGTAVEVNGTAYPDEMFAGRITFIAYTVDPATRTVSARLEIDNPDYKLKPGMYATAVIRTPVGSVTEVTSGTATTSAPQTVAKTPTDDLVNTFLSLANAFAHDKADATALDKLIVAAKTLGSKGPSEIRANASTIADQLGGLKGKELAEQRKLLKPISDEIVELVKAVPAGRLLHVAYCPMVKAHWLQTIKAVENPFYGSEMFDCGKISDTIEPKGGKDVGSYVTGYWCPVMPDRLYDSPEQCPLDKFPMKYARVEKTLAVPASALIDTGTRKVVYVESAPETFDMVEVKLANRAGEFYPVLGGVRPDDRVATAGTFLVDAENRLNPAAAAQYFGASGGPQKD